jgi:alpha-glucosidase
MRWGCPVFAWFCCSVNAATQLLCHLSAAEFPELKSPNGQIEFKLSSRQGELSIDVSLARRPVLESSILSIQLDGKNISRGAVPVDVKLTRGQETYPFLGVHSTATNHFEGAAVEMKSENHAKWFLEMRAFNDGVAFRHIVPGDGRRVPDESTSFVLPEGSVVWHHDLGGHYEDVHRKTPASDLKADDWIAPPMTFKTPAGIYASITEAGLSNYSGMALQVTGARKISVGLGHKHPISYPFRLRYSNDVDRVTQPYATVGQITSPWRVIMIGPDLNTLVNSDIVQNLCEPPDSKLFPNGSRTDWIKPGRAVWKYLDGGANSFENMMDFSRWAGELGFEHHVIEGFWSRWSDEQIRQLVEHSKRNGVGVWFWRHSRELRTPDRQEAFFKKLQTNGVVGAKIDFFDHEQGDVVNLYTQLLRKAAEHKILVNFHGANKPTGEPRTWPNELIREGVRGMESSRLQARAIHNTTLPFTRYLAGTGDYTPVHFGARKGDTTEAHQIATAAIFNEPLLTYAAHPTNLLRHPALPMIKAIPAVWDETRVLPPSEISRLVIFARRSGTDWYLAILNGPEETSAQIPFSFLGGGNYSMLEVRDDVENSERPVQISEKTISRLDAIELKLTVGGGYIARFRKN